MTKSHFRSVKIYGKFTDENLPVLMIGNHFSWWDGFIANILNNRVLRRRFHVMMLEEQLRDRLFLNKAGAYSINPGSQSSVKESLDYTVELLKSSENLVVFYPQGKFQSISDHPVRFEKGAGHLLNRLKGGVHLVFYAALLDYFEHRKPSLNIYFTQVEAKLNRNDFNLENEYNLFLAECIKQQVPGS
jgi:1-acyl-sn-glycerol-3-phosphate acyltransferase